MPSFSVTVTVPSGSSPFVPLSFTVARVKVAEVLPAGNVNCWLPSSFLFTKSLPAASVTVTVTVRSFFGASSATTVIEAVPPSVTVRVGFFILSTEASTVNTGDRPYNGYLASLSLAAKPIVFDVEAREPTVPSLLLPPLSFSNLMLSFPNLSQPVPLFLLPVQTCVTVVAFEPDGSLAALLSQVPS